MSYLIAKDLAKQIQSENLSQVIGGDSSILAAAELTAIAEATSYLTQKYDTTQEFRSLLEWDASKIYAATDRVYLSAPAYNASGTYDPGDLCLQNGSIYECITAITDPEAFNPDEWQLLGSQFDIFHVAYPKPLFDYNAAYWVGNKVYWKGKIYSALIATSPISHQNYIQYRHVDNLPLPNVAPDDPYSGNRYWAYVSTHSVPAGMDILDTDYWTYGDNRSQQLLTYVIDITLYHVHSRIAPRNIPDLRVKRYDDARAWLRAAAKGDITAALPELAPPQGGRIRWGGNTKLINTY